MNIGIVFYKDDGYFFGTSPNTFLAEQSSLLTSPVLSLSEGEGRNAVYLALQGLQVSGVDLSEVALAKAEELAKINNVEIEMIQSDLASFQPQENYYNSVVSIFAINLQIVRGLFMQRILNSG